MSGEISKSSGELGEKRVSDFLELIGWIPNQSNLSITCYESDKHNKAGDLKGTHGIDKCFCYESPLDISTLIHTVISVKHTINSYPSSPNSNFKEYVHDLAHTIECFNESEEISQNRDDFDVDDEQVIGILFWLSSGNNTHNAIIEKVSNPILNKDLVYERIHVLDNDRLDFITDAINLVKNKYKDFTYSFYYIDTPTNLSSSQKVSSGQLLPIEMLSSDIQVFKLEREKEVVLVLVVKNEFHEDTLKRILGLAHSLSNDLTSNVHIYFPKFDSIQLSNINIVDRIKSQFRQKSFIKNTHIFGYHLGHKDIKVDVEISTQKPNNEITEEDIDNGKVLPYGEYLRSLLSTSLITATQLKNILKEKGIYLCNFTKDEMIPILSSMILTPEEFDVLKEHQKTKEDTEKTYESRIKTTKPVKIEEIKKAVKTFDLNKIDNKKFKNYKYKTSKVSLQENKDKTSLIVGYEIERKQRNKSWSEQKENFKSNVTLSLNKGNVEIIAKNNATAKETVEINRIIINYVKEKLVENKIIRNVIDEEKILMSDMSNEQIISFLLAFTDNKKLNNIEFIDILTIDIEIDETISLPNDNKLKWMENKIQKLKLDGKKIEDIEILTKEENHKYLKCWSIIAKYKFNNATAKGDVKLEFRFNNSGKKEFFVEITKYNFDKKLYKQKDIKSMVLKDIDLIKYTKYQEIKKENEI